MKKDGGYYFVLSLNKRFDHRGTAFFKTRIAGQSLTLNLLKKK
jgi:hypothetical protein